MYGLTKASVRASKLPSTECDDFIAKFIRSHHIDESETLTIRMLSHVAHPLKEKRLFRDFRNGADEFIYRNCTLFTFFDTGQNTDICFFSIFFQLYGNECAEPNRNTAYVSYIDSINIFPSQNRTKVYRLILIGLFAYLKTKGFETIFLWSCPPKQNQDYIFYFKPPKMKMPTKERLSTWYKELLLLGQKLNVIHSYSGIKDYALSEHWESLNDVPYLEGDMWVTRMEEAVKSVRQEAQKLRTEILKMRARSETHPNINERDKKKLKNLKQRLNMKLQQVTNYDKNDKLWKLMNTQITGFNSQYFAIKLSETSSNQKRQDFQIIDKWPWISDRHLFVDFFWGNMLEFSSERRAQYSTFVMLHRLLAEGKICVQCETAAESVSVRIYLIDLCKLLTVLI